MNFIDWLLYKSHDNLLNSGFIQTFIAMPACGETTHDALGCVLMGGEL
jgi:hypothetical protein